jgi:regulator of RNase E activity RraA
MTSTTELKPLPEGVLDNLRQVSTSTIATQLYKRGFRQPQMLGVRPLSTVADGFVAEAFTMRFIPAREDVNTLDPYRSGNTLQWDAFESVPPGHVLVVDSRGDTRAASGGDMLMTRAWKRGVAGVVTDGGLRDGHVLSQLPFPTYAAAVTITTRAAWHHVADLQVPIGCAGVAVYPGDVIVADRDGVLVVPREVAIEIAEPSLEQEKLEAFVATKIRAGEPLAGNYPPGDAVKAEYKASLAGE